MNFFALFKRLGFAILLLGLIAVAAHAQSTSTAAEASARPPTDLTGELLQKPDLPQYNTLQGQIHRRGAARVIVGLESPMEPLAALQTGRSENRQARRAQRAAISRLQNGALEQLNHQNINAIKRFKHVPYMALEVNSVALERLRQLSDVISIQEDELLRPTLATSIPLIGGDIAWNGGYSGLGQTIAILDSGVDKFHSFLSGKVVAEACFSTTSTMTSTLCPDGSDTQIGDGAGIHCNGISACKHGTHVAGIAAGQSSSFSGVAHDASLIAIQVFSRIDKPEYCGSSSPCVAAYTSDLIAALEHVYDVRDTYNIAAINLSLGGGTYTSASECDNRNPSTKAVIDKLSATGIATVIAAGNNGKSDALSSPGCISSAISVGATTKSDVVASYSNSAAWLSLLAPGSSIKSSVPDGGYATMSGTSMATPHVAGAWAVLKQHAPDASVDEILATLADNGVSILDGRNGLSTARIQVDTATATAPVVPLVIETTRLPDAVAGLAYLATLSAQGGLPPYRWRIIDGTLPAGLSLDLDTGTITGTATLTGSSTFTVAVGDSASATAVQPFEFLVEGDPPMITSVTATPSILVGTHESQLEVIAWDPDTDPAHFSYRWIVPPDQGAVDDPTSPKPVYTPPEISSPQTVTLTVEVSDGAATTRQTLNITCLPGFVDEDGDSLPDVWEVANGLNPSVNDTQADPDGDGYSNAQEYASGTDPQRTTSKPEGANGVAYVLFRDRLDDDQYADRWYLGWADLGSDASLSDTDSVFQSSPAFDTCNSTLLESIATVDATDAVLHAQVSLETDGTTSVGLRKDNDPNNRIEVQFDSEATPYLRILSWDTGVETRVPAPIPTDYAGTDVDIRIVKRGASYHILVNNVLQGSLSNLGLGDTVLRPFIAATTCPADAGFGAGRFELVEVLLDRDADALADLYEDKDLDGRVGIGESDPLDPDHDNDTVLDGFDNCLFKANGNQRDSDDDGYGSLCDGDLDNDGTVSTPDLVLFRDALFTRNSKDADFDGDGTVSTPDLVLFRQMLFNPPGPSGLIP